MGTVLLDLYRRRFPALVDGGFNWVDVRDVVAGALAAEQKGRVGERYILSGRWTSFAELAGVVHEITRVPIPRLVTPMWLARVGAGVTEAYGRVTGAPVRFTGESLKALRHWREISCDKAKRELGYDPRPLRDTVADTFTWFHEAGVIPAARLAL
jgi:dihydroflavonol-4-reductase